MSIYGWLSLLAAWAGVAGAAVLAAFAFTNPVTIGPAGVTTWFVLLYSVLGCLLTLLLYSVKTYLHVQAVRIARLRYSWRQGLLLAGWFTALLALSSLHQLGVLDAILLGLLLVIVEVYVRFRWP